MSTTNTFNAEAAAFRPSQIGEQKTTALAYNPSAAVFQPRSQEPSLSPKAPTFLPQQKLAPEAAIFIPQCPPIHSTGHQKQEEVAQQHVVISFPIDTDAVSEVNNPESDVTQKELVEMSNSVVSQDNDADPEPRVSTSPESGTLVSTEDLDSDTTAEDDAELTESLTFEGFKFNADALSFVSKPTKPFVFNPEAVDFNTGKSKIISLNSGASDFVSKKDKPFTFNPRALDFVSEKDESFVFDSQARPFVQTKSKAFCFDAEAPEFNPVKKTALVFNPLGLEFIYEKTESFVFNPEAYDFVSKNVYAFAFNPEACKFVSKVKELFAFNPEAVVFAITDRAAASEELESSVTPLIQHLTLALEAPQVEPLKTSRKLAPSARQIESETQEAEMDYDEDDQEYHHHEKSVQSPVHHTGFFRQPVYTKSATPPSVSLAIIRGTARFQHITSFDDKNKLRVGCLIHNASAYIDPVIYRGDKTILGRYHGSALQDQVTGATTKAYRDFGDWWEDTYQVDEDMPELDLFDPAEYKETEIMFNGVMWNETAPSADDIVAKARASDDKMFKGALKRYNDAVERCTVGRGMSRLSQVVLPEDVVEPKRPSAAQLADERARQKIRDLDALSDWGDDVDDDGDDETNAAVQVSGLSEDEVLKKIRALPSLPRSWSEYEEEDGEEEEEDAQSSSSNNSDGEEITCLPTPRILLQWPTQPNPYNQRSSTFALTRSQPGRWESQNLHARDLMLNGSESNEVFYENSSFRPNTNIGTHPDDVVAHILQPETEQATTLQSNTVDAASAEEAVMGGESFDTQPGTSSTSSTPPPAYQSVEDLTLSHLSMNDQLPQFTEQSTASLPYSQQLIEASQSPPALDAQISTQEPDQVVTQPSETPHQAHTLVDLPEDQVVKDFTPQKQKKQRHITSGPRGKISRVGLGLAGKFGRSRKPKATTPSVKTTPVSEVRAATWSKLVRRCGRVPVVEEKNDGREVEEQAKESSWTYRAWKKCKGLMKGRKEKEMK